MIQYAAADQRPAACRQLLRIGSDWEARYTPLHTPRRRAQHTITRFLFIDGPTTRAPRFLPAGSRTDAPGALPRADASSALPRTVASSALPRPSHAPIPLAPSSCPHSPQLLPSIVFSNPFKYPSTHEQRPRPGYPKLHPRTRVSIQLNPRNVHL